MSTELLTRDELRAMSLTVDLVDLVTRHVIGDGATRGQDVNEFVRHVHAIQHMVMSQAAARAYPDGFRLLGGVLT